MGEAKRRNKTSQHHSTRPDSHVLSAENFRFDFPLDLKRQFAVSGAAATAVIAARARAGETESGILADIFEMAPLVVVAWPDKSQPLGFAVGLAKGMERARRGIALGLKEDMEFVCIPTFSERRGYELALKYGDVRTFKTKFDSSVPGARDAAFAEGERIARAASIQPRA